MDPAADDNTLIDQLRNGDRDVLNDALDITATDDGQTVEAAHVADNGEEVTLHFAYYTAYRSTEKSPVEEINIYALDNNDEHAD